MIEERKEELRQLLNEAMKNLEIRNPFGQGNISYSKVDYKNILNQRLTFYGIGIDHLHNSVYLQYQPEIENEKTKTKILEFIKKELNQFIQNDEIGYTLYNVDGCSTNGFHLSKPRSSRIQLSDLLKYLLKVTIAYGVDKAVLAFDEDCRLKGKYRNYQSITSLEGITIETEIQICRGIRLEPIPRDIAFQLNYKNSRRNHHRHRDVGQTLLIIERLMYFVFHKPKEKPFNEGHIVNLPFQVEENEIELSSDGIVGDFRETFCQALSLACNTMVMFDYFWDYSAADAFRSILGDYKVYYSGPIGKSVKASQSEIEEAKRLYKILEIFDQEPIDREEKKAKGKFQIAIERWRKSKTYQNSEDQLIDLVIALEALYLPDKGESTFKLAVRVSWHLAKGREDREKRLAEFKELYKRRSDVVHGGELKRNVRIREESISIFDFITRTQSLCQQSIIKILKTYSEDGKFPDNDYWDSSILGEDHSSASC